MKFGTGVVILGSEKPRSRELAAWCCCTQVAALILLLAAAALRPSSHPET